MSDSSGLNAQRCFSLSLWKAICKMVFSDMRIPPEWESLPSPLGQNSIPLSEGLPTSAHPDCPLSQYTTIQTRSQPDHSLERYSPQLRSKCVHYHFPLWFHLCTWSQHTDLSRGIDIGLTFDRNLSGTQRARAHDCRGVFRLIASQVGRGRSRIIWGRVSES